MTMRQRKRRIPHPRSHQVFEVKVCASCFFINLAWRRSCHYCGSTRMAA